MTYRDVRKAISKANELHTFDLTRSNQNPLIDENSSLIEKIDRSHFSYTWAPKPMVDKHIINVCFQLSRHNMEDYYNKTNFCGGWKSGRIIRMMNTKSNYYFIIFDKDKSVVGFIFYRFIAMDENQPVTPVCYIYELHLREFTGLGFGHLLVKLAKNVATRYNMVKNSKALNFYYKCGFIADESDPDSINNEESTDIVYKILKL